VLQGRPIPAETRQRPSFRLHSPRCRETSLSKSIEGQTRKLSDVDMESPFSWRIRRLWLLAEADREMFIILDLQMGGDVRAATTGDFLFSMRL